MQHLPFYTLTADNFILTVLMEDAPLHTDEHPFCDDPTCRCHTDEDLFRQHIYKPYEQGLLTPTEGLRILWGRQVLAETERITDEEMAEIMNEPSPLEDDYHRSFFDGLDPDDLEDHPF